MCRGPEHDRTDAVERQSHQDGDFVALALEDLSGDGRVEKVTAAKVHDLETGRFEPGDTKDLKVMGKRVSACLET